MIGVEARELRVGDVILGGVGTVLMMPKSPDEWGEITFTVKEDDGSLYRVKVEADAYFRIEREGQ